jgi:ribosomal protein S24E
MNTSIVRFKYKQKNTIVARKEQNWIITSESQSTPEDKETKKIGAFLELGVRYGRGNLAMEGINSN